MNLERLAMRVCVRLAQMGRRFGGLRVGIRARAHMPRPGMREAEGLWAPPYFTFEAHLPRHAHARSAMSADDTASAGGGGERCLEPLLLCGCSVL